MRQHQTFGKVVASMKQLTVQRNQALSAGFTLVELLAVIGIIGVLVATLLPALSKAQQSAKAVQCGAQLRQIGTAFNMYLNNSRGMAFWRGPDITINGMDWFCFGGKETGNVCLQQQNLFNRILPRPLNVYLSNNIKVFRCPSDTEPAPWSLDSVSSFDWVGNSYGFNATGHPLSPTPSSGLAGAKPARIHASAQTVVFFEAATLYDVSWHPKARGNFCFLDGHIELRKMPAKNDNSVAWGNGSPVTGYP